MATAPTPSPAPAPAAGASSAKTSAPAPAPAPTSSAKSSSTKSSAKTATKASGAGTKAKKPARRKKPTAKSSGGSSNQATWTAARAAQMDLSSQRNQSAARLSDPLWYRIEDVLPTEESAMAENPKILPEQVQIVDAALAHNNLTRSDVTPQAFACLLEQARRFALEIIADSQDYAFVANRSEINRADLQLASEMRPDHPLNVTTQLPKLIFLAHQRNRKPLPPIPVQCYSGVLLPPKDHQLTARTFDVVSGAQVAQKMVQSMPAQPAKKVSFSKPKPSYGAARGRQIPVNLKAKESSTPAPAPSADSASSTSKDGPKATAASSSSAATTAPAKTGAPAPASSSTPAAATPAPAPKTAS